MALPKSFRPYSLTHATLLPAVTCLMILSHGSEVRSAEDDGFGPLRNPRGANASECNGNDRNFSGGSCVCADGFEQIGTVVVFDTEVDGVTYPSCTPNVSFPDLGSSDPGDPDDQLPGTSTPPPPAVPTVQECTARHEGCLDDMTTAVQQCKRDASDFFVQQINDNTPCHGQPGFDLWNRQDAAVHIKDIFGNIIGTVDILCNDIRFDEDSGAGRACMNEFRKNGLILCTQGQNHTTFGESATDTAKIGFKFDFLTGEGGSSRTLSIQEHIQRGEGSDNACWRAGNLGRASCDKVRDSCIAKAEGAAMMQAVVAPVERENLISRIDRGLLGLAEPQSGRGPRVDILGTRPESPQGAQRVFRPLEQARGESLYWHLFRLRFLAAWTAFIKNENIDSAMQGRMEAAFAEAQGGFRRLNDFGTLLSALRFTTDAETGEVGLVDSVAIHDAYLERGGFMADYRAATATFDQEVEAILSPEQTARFHRKVWPGVAMIGISRPMLINTQVVVE